MKSTKHQTSSALLPERARLRAQQHVYEAGSQVVSMRLDKQGSLRSRTGALRGIFLLLTFGLWTLDFGLWTSSAAQNTNSGSGLSDYRNFEVIAKKNIFNPRRSPEYVPTEKPVVRTRTETLALVGVMNYGKGPLAFFDGTRSDYRKVLKPNENIAGFKVTAIAPSAVKLASSTNEIELQLGMQLSREQEGEWKLAMRPENLDTSYARATPMRSASQVNSDRASESDQNNNPFGAIGNFFANGGFRGGGFPGGGFPQTTPQASPAQPTVTPPPTTQPAAPADPNDILARMAARRAQETGESSPDQRPEPSPNQGAPSQPDQGQPRSGQPPEPSPGQSPLQPPSQRSEPPNP
jgi:hypothetical protein